MRIQAMTAAAVLVLTAAACSPAEEKAPAPVEAPLSGRAAIYAAGEQNAEAFVRALYANAAAPLANDPAAASITPGRDPLYTRTLNALVGADFHAAKGEVPYLNYDPICACQDADGFALTALKMTPDGDRAASAEVTFTNHGQTQRQTLKLAKEGPMWRIADVIDGQGQSLHDALMAIAEKAEG
ncbi:MULTISPECIES: DUF3828 domain-containing protein [unclassified Brevundimonas]|uniref:DUF3828 domain-containing protein n=1 Tax=unclassified Brevundimonas TaxID=2622653 RepID=UPI000CFD4036|nr:MULTISPECIES: DUF3828 domain-containing protein [unclassified Brevundimonas]PRA30441.1 DUF3828 domain-containing protein [Brevundimonas sp. MYb27]PQZ83281.1 DUF3828 domain-containing protein [Brevundimonas sp. MYb31]PRB16185.1 DUF3828 domain-containing protein [Brevundimonas sp. MYb52]PRB35203.1 DUF3828 domain-containing protein [Brevundimonas sp. MYb46]PRB46099.1 DUF3828 domain-containing protein [Brevundimonas sp. MYb33]